MGTEVGSAAWLEPEAALAAADDTGGVPESALAEAVNGNALAGAAPGTALAGAAPGTALPAGLAPGATAFPD